MPYCPECGAEFGRGIRRCPECLVDLLEELEEPSLYENPDENLVLIQESATPATATRIMEILGKHGILSVVEEVSQSKGQAAPGTAHILVSQKDEARSRELLKSI
jgi:predicted Zn-ribbon and HTH transcriptional regulator